MSQSSNLPPKYVAYFDQIDAHEELLLWEVLKERIHLDPNSDDSPSILAASVMNTIIDLMLPGVMESHLSDTTKNETEQAEAIALYIEEHMSFEEQRLLGMLSNIVSQYTTALCVLRGIGWKPATVKLSEEFGL